MKPMASKKWTEVPHQIWYRTSAGMKPMMGKTRSDPFADLLGTGFAQFQSHCGVGGLARERNGCLELLAVHSRHPGKGEFRKFIGVAKKNYRGILVLSIWNPDLEQMLRRYGFTPFTRTESDGEQMDGMEWRLQSK